MCCRFQRFYFCLSGGKVQVPRVGCLALPVFQTATAAPGTAAAATLRRLCVWRDDASGANEPKGSAMLASLARGEFDAMVLLRAAKPQWTEPPNDLNSNSSSSVGGGRYEVPSWPIGGGAPLAGARTEPSRKTLLLLGANGGTAQQPPRAAFALARVAGERDAFAVAFAAPLSPLHAFAAACACVASAAKGADVAMAGAPWPAAAPARPASTPRAAAAIGAAVSGLVSAAGPSQRQVLPPLAAAASAALPSLPLSSGEEGAVAAAAVVSARRSLWPASQLRGADDGGSIAAEVDASGLGRGSWSSSSSLPRGSQGRGDSASFDGSSGYGGPRSPADYPPGSLAARLQPFSPLAAAASHVAEAALVAGLDYFTDMPPGYPPPNAQTDAHADTGGGGDGGVSEGRRGAPRSDGSVDAPSGEEGWANGEEDAYDHDSWAEEGPGRSHDGVPNADAEDEERGGGSLPRSRRQELGAPRLARVTWGDDARRLKAAARWHGVRFLCGAGLQHEHAQVRAHASGQGAHGGGGGVERPKPS
jgi:hypothetical protein